MPPPACGVGVTDHLARPVDGHRGRGGAAQGAQVGQRAAGAPGDRVRLRSSRAGIADHEPGGVQRGRDGGAARAECAEVHHAAAGRPREGTGLATGVVGAADDLAALDGGRIGLLAAGQHAQVGQRGAVVQEGPGHAVRRGGIADYVTVGIHIGRSRDRPAERAQVDHTTARGPGEGVDVAPVGGEAAEHLAAAVHGRGGGIAAGRAAEVLQAGTAGPAKRVGGAVGQAGAAHHLAGRIDGPGRRRAAAEGAEIRGRGLRQVTHGSRC